MLYWKVCLESVSSLSSNLTYALQLVYVNRRTKIESGQRTTSLSFMLNNKRGAIGRALASVPAAYRAESFMAGQFGMFIQI